MLKLQLLEVKKAQLVPARRMASLVGKIVSMSISLGLVTRLMTRALYDTLHHRVAWCKNLTLMTEALQELELF